MKAGKSIVGKVQVHEVGGREVGEEQEVVVEFLDRMEGEDTVTINVPVPGVGFVRLDFQLSEMVRAVMLAPTFT